jgi:3-hydroxyisobutyrate dehydrogenase
MGYAMASNIRKKMPPSSTLYINDINALACSRFHDEHSKIGPIEIVSTAREAAENSQVVITIVPGAADVKKVYLDEETGVIAARKDAERVLCECSTIDVKSTREVGEALKERGLGVYVDTPVSVSPHATHHTSTVTDATQSRAASPQPNAATSAC